MYIRNTTSKIRSVLVTLALLEIAIGAQRAGGQIVRLSFRSEPGDWVGAGQVFDRTYAVAPALFPTSEVLGVLDGQPTYVRFVLPSTEAPTAFFQFTSHLLGVPLQPGFYPDAYRPIFEAPGHPGFEFGFDGRGCNSLTANFTILQASIAPDGSAPNGWRIDYFSASFEQHCEGGVPGVYGNFTFTAVPEPSTIALLVVAGAACSLWRRRVQKRSIEHPA